MHDFIAIWPDVATNSLEFQSLTPNSTGRHTYLTKGFDSRAIEDILPATLVASIFSPHRESATLLLLDSEMSPAWHTYDWEGATYSGQPASAQLLAVRRASVVFGVAGQSHATNARWLNLFPRNEYNFDAEFSPLIKQERLRPCVPRYFDSCMGGASDLFILAHGDTRGLVDLNGNTFEISETTILPKRVWLLACNRNGAMHALARKLMDWGVSTVVVATGDLSAPQMAPIIRDWLSSGATDPATWIASVRTSRHHEGGMRSLTVWGETCLDNSFSASWNQLSWDFKHGRNRSPPLDDEMRLEEFQAANAVLDAVDTWPLTQEWMLPPMLWQAEKYDHPRMRELEIRLGNASSPQALRALATAARRIGNYPQMAKYLSRLLAIDELPDQERAEYLGALANLLIDLDLPDSAFVVTDIHEDCLLDEPQARQLADFKRMDWRARIAARQGRFLAAIDLMTSKRCLADIDDGRELAWQTYLAAWALVAGQVEPPFAKDFSQETRHLLSQTEKLEIGHGNETTAYLLRALAAYAWASGDDVCLNEALTWMHLAEDRLMENDPGPWAYAIAYLHLSGVVDTVLFERAMNALERNRYYFEAAVFQQMTGNAQEHNRLITRFQRRRIGTLEKLGELGAISITELLAEANSRVDLEASEVVRSRSIDAAKCGVIPL